MTDIEKIACAIIKWLAFKTRVRLIIYMGLQILSLFNKNKTELLAESV